ncbi:hypothetical protein SELMODRAFT_442593 [Selaginella moellendorffii]|uniref:Biogenesis of lysosome-related organelles complex 1 subunit 2 n=1 Tax=Selaginella moellendorffii TaxID=88036 RepID=D8RU93_SELML|nr:biogenesis of lysosome-related organelles complex 1 subunit 2 [Selaginella moellendorffii]EFJ24164.1 hypothetical protein SELMODRAFT_442593 [Selaginella moellendorffii]|eukprot:XP_002974644.1 biogenesis of lysosome-related organelles complex 1 subunit 2 [Selaginella moellendorffii]
MEDSPPPPPPPHSLVDSSSLAKAMGGLALNLASVARGELQGAGTHAELIEKLNLKVGTEYDDYADFASGLLVFVERLKQQNESLCSNLKVIQEIDDEVRHLEAIVSTLDGYTATLETKIKNAYNA